jgi:hypothetical protein
MATASTRIQRRRVCHNSTTTIAENAMEEWWKQPLRGEQGAGQRIVTGNRGTWRPKVQSRAHVCLGVRRSPLPISSTAETAANRPW